MAKNYVECPQIAKMSAFESKSGSSNPMEIVEVLNWYVGALLASYNYNPDQLARRQAAFKLHSYLGHFRYVF